MYYITQKKNQHQQQLQLEVGGGEGEETIKILLINPRQQKAMSVKRGEKASSAKKSEIAIKNRDKCET